MAQAWRAIGVSYEQRRVALECTTRRVRSEPGSEAGNDVVAEAPRGVVGSEFVTLSQAKVFPHGCGSCRWARFVF